MNEPVETIFLKDNHVLKIYNDDNASNPREWDNLGTMICWHRRYNLGDTKDSKDFRDTEHLFEFLSGTHFDAEEFENVPEEEVWERISDRAHDNAVILPLSLYDHSGISMSVGSVRNDWDSGQVGWIYLTYERARKEFKVLEGDLVEEWYGPNKGQHVPLRDIMVRILEGEVETYNQYLTGDTYRFKVIKKRSVTWINKDNPEEEVTEVEEELIDSCDGFFGSDWEENGMLGYIDQNLIPEKN
jgi:hypothetical protein